MLRLRLLNLLIPLLLHASTLAAEEGPSAMPPGTDFGTGISLRHATPLAAVLDAPEGFETKKILLHGRISDVCQRKGCWTILRDGDAHLRIRFQDYGFFLPKDATGAEAFVEGSVKVEVLSEKAARHYAEESRNGDPSAIEGPQREVGFTATGVRLVGRN